MKVLLVCRSRSHGNTARVAHAMAEVFDATVVTPSQVVPEALGEYDVVGFGSGIYGFSFDDELRTLVASLPHVPGRDAFIFATSGAGRVIERPFRTPLAALLRSAGYDVVGTFCCRGYDTWLPLRLVGGVNKGHPDDADLARARTFAEQVRNRIAGLSTSA